MSTQTESTPLVTAQTVASNAFNQVNTVMSQYLAKENRESAGHRARDSLQNLQHSARDGDFSIRLLALISGLALVISAGFGFFDLISKFRITNAILEFYTLVLGLIMLLLESRGHLQWQRRQESLPHATHLRGAEGCFRNLYRYALFLKFVWGRGGLYFVAGSLQLAQGHMVDFCIGGFVMLVGVLYIWIGRGTAAKLTQLRQALSEQTLRSKFQEADTDGNGTLSLENFKVLTDNLGMKLSRRECEVAFLCMDRSDAGKISFDDLQTWWVEWEEGVGMI